jgi:prophage antirepressor-like protein
MMNNVFDRMDDNMKNSNVVNTGASESGANKSELRIFEKPEFGQVRTIEIDGKIYFAGVDVATALGYENPTKAVLTHCKSNNILKRYVVPEGSVNGFGGININFIPEGDVYRLIIKSNLPRAEAFEEWVMEEVLPTIRKTGRYAVNEDGEPRDELDIIIEVALKMQAQRKELRAQKKMIDAANKRIDELEATVTTHPKSYYTIAGYAALIRKPVTTQEASVLGKEATRLCKMHNIRKSETEDPRFGRVGLYPVQILEQVFLQKPLLLCEEDPIL